MCYVGMFMKVYTSCEAFYFGCNLLQAMKLGVIHKVRTQNFKAF